MERDHSGRIALMHDGVVAGIFDEDNAAHWDGCNKYGLGNFSLEWIGAEPLRLEGLHTRLGLAAPTAGDRHHD